MKQNSPTIGKSELEQEIQLKIIAIVPAYNEHERIKDTVAALLNIRDKLDRDLFRFDYMVYVVDDGSDDDTGNLAKEAGASRVIRHRSNRGLGAAVRTGLIAARADGADIAIKFDADLQHEPNDVAALVSPIVADEADVVYGNRFERIEYKMPLVRRIGNSVFTALMRQMTGWPLRDSQPGIFAVSRAYLEVLRLPGDYNYTQQLLLDAYHKGMRFAHVPVTFRKRLTGRSFISLAYPFKVLPQILMVLVGIKPMQVFGPIGLLFLAAALGVFFIETATWFWGDALKPVRSVNFVLGASLFGLQTLFFGLLAQLIVER